MKLEKTSNKNCCQLVLSVFLVDANNSLTQIIYFNDIIVDRIEHDQHVCETHRNHVTQQ